MPSDDEGPVSFADAAVPTGARAVAVTLAKLLVFDCNKTDIEHTLVGAVQYIQTNIKMIFAGDVRMFPGNPFHDPYMRRRSLSP